MARIWVNKLTKQRALKKRAQKRLAAQQCSSLSFFESGALEGKEQESLAISCWPLSRPCWPFSWPRPINTLVRNHQFDPSPAQSHKTLQLITASR